MNDDELVQRLTETLHAKAESITSPSGAWEPEVIELPRRRTWLFVPAGLAAAIVAAVAVALSVGNGQTSRSHVGPPTSFATPPTLGPGQTAPPPTTTTTVPTFHGPAGGPVPKGFSPSSVTFVSPAEGWAMGTAPCAAAPCTSIVRTTDGGATWQGIPAPRAAIDSMPGVRTLRFADVRDGWAFGPSLWATHDGGATWHQVTLPGVPADAQVEDLAASGGVAQLAVTDDGGRVRIASAPVGSDAWVLSPVTVALGAGPVPSGQFVLHGGVGWFVQVDRTVVGGAQLAGGTWSAWTPPCASAVGPGQIDATSATTLVAACDTGLWGGGSHHETFETSDDGGRSFTPSAADPPVVDGTLVATPAPGHATVAGSDSQGLLLVATVDGGATWSVTHRGSGGWNDLGFTTPSQGVAVGGGQLLMTRDGGRTWAPVGF